MVRTVVECLREGIFSAFSLSWRCSGKCNFDETEIGFRGLGSKHSGRGAGVFGQVRLLRRIARRQWELRTLGAGKSVWRRGCARGDARVASIDIVRGIKEAAGRVARRACHLLASLRYGKGISEEIGAIPT